MTVRITALSITLLSRKTLNIRKNRDTQNNDIQCSESFMLSAPIKLIILSNVMLGVVMQNVQILLQTSKGYFKNTVRYHESDNSITSQPL
jgi:hypothetical protein